MAVLRVVFWAKFREFGMISVAPRNIKPLVVSPALAVIARETVWAVLERYGAGRWRGSLVLDDRQCVTEDSPGDAKQNGVDHNQPPLDPNPPSPRSLTTN